MIPEGTAAMTEDERNISPYLRRRLRSYEEARRDRAQKARRGRRRPPKQDPADKPKREDGGDGPCES